MNKAPCLPVYSFNYHLCNVRPGIPGDFRCTRYAPPVIQATTLQDTYNKNIQNYLQVHLNACLYICKCICIFVLVNENAWVCLHVNILMYIFPCRFNGGYSDFPRLIIIMLQAREFCKLVLFFQKNSF